MAHGALGKVPQKNEKVSTLLNTDSLIAKKAHAATGTLLSHRQRTTARKLVRDPHCQWSLAQLPCFSETQRTCEPEKSPTHLSAIKHHGGHL